MGIQAEAVVRYQIETLATCLREIDDLARELAFEELVSDRSFALDVNWPMYEALEKVGHFQVTTAREEDGRLSGYHMVVWGRSAHHRILAAEDAAAFVRPMPGRIWKLVRMYRFTLSSLLARGVQRFCFRVKDAHDFGCVLKRLGFTLDEHVYMMTVRT